MSLCNPSGTNHAFYFHQILHARTRGATESIVAVPLRKTGTRRHFYDFSDVVMVQTRAGMI